MAAESYAFCKDYAAFWLKAKGDPLSRRIVKPWVATVDV
jgi:hypothetical protein